MPRSEATISINCSPEDAWSYLVDPDNLPVWNSAIVTAEADGEFAVGTKIRGQLKFLGKKIDFVNELTELDAPKRSGYRSVESPFPFEGATMVEPDGDGCQVSLFVETKNLGGIFGKLGDPVVAKMYGRQMRSDLENLKDLLEAS